MDDFGNNLRPLVYCMILMLSEDFLLCKGNACMRAEDVYETTDSDRYEDKECGK